MASELNAQAASVRRVIDQLKQRGRAVPHPLAEAEATLCQLAELADWVRSYAQTEDEEKFTDEFAERVVTILRLPVVKA